MPTGEFTAPLYRRPPNLVAAGRRKLGDAFPSKGVFVGRRVGRRKIVPYYDRGQIEDGALDGWHLEICYLHDQVDVLFAQIQGSARIRLEDGTILRVNYDSHNGWPYTPVGRALVDGKIMTKDQVSMQSIRDWMEANPDQAKDIRRQNKSYVFFRITDLATEDEAVGGEGVQLVPGRSIAVDRSLHAYGTPFFIQADLPIANEKATTKFDRLVVRAGYRLGHRRTGAGRYLFRRRRRSRAHRRPHQKSRRVRDAAAARARSGRSWPRYAAAAGAPELFASISARTTHGRSHGARRCRAGGDARSQRRLLQRRNRKQRPGRRQ